MRIEPLFQTAMPDFIGIGAAKAGTSWLWANLRRHPDIWTPRTKEKHFFDRRIEQKYFPFISDELERKLRYISFFLPGKVLGKVTGEFTPAYAIISEEKIKLFHLWMPDVKLFFVMRDPVARAWSHAKKDFKKFSKKPLIEASEREVIAFFDLPGVARRGDYFSCLSNWMKFYNREQLFICFLEEFAADYYVILQEAFHFLGLDTDIEFDWDAVKIPVHVGAKMPIPSSIQNYLSNVLYQQNGSLESLIGRKVPWNK